MLLVTNRVKLFYRPEGLAGETSHVIDQLRIQRAGKSLLVSNPTPYYASISQALVIDGNKHIAIEQADMLPPYSQADWPAVARLTAGELTVMLNVNNDYDAEVSRTVMLPR